LEKIIIDDTPIKVNLIGWTPEGIVIVKHLDQTDQWGGAVYRVIDAVEDSLLYSIFYGEEYSSYADSGFSDIIGEEIEDKWTEILDKYNMADEKSLNSEFTGKLPEDFPCINDGILYYAWFEYDIEEFDIPVKSEYSDKLYTYNCILNLYVGNKEMKKSITK
jgi:hypothetical protein